LADGRFHNKKSTSARRFALRLGNLDPKETPEVIALGCAFLQQTVDAPVDGHWCAAVPPQEVTNRGCNGGGVFETATRERRIRLQSRVQTKPK
jgi:hypothetical protein